MYTQKHSNMNSQKSASKSQKTVPPPILSTEYKTQVWATAYLGKRGYTISKSVLTKEDENFLKKDLFLKPELSGANYGVEPEGFPVYRESEKKIYIPRFYGVERYGSPHRSEIEPGLDICVPFVKTLRDYQEKIVQTYLDAVGQHTQSGGVLQVYTGAGKTICALKIIASLQKKTMILVHKEFLMNQWIERIAEFLPTAKVGKIQGQKCDIDNKDIVIAMIQTMYNRTFPPEVYSQFGLTIVDEVHHIGSQEFSRTLLNTITPYMLGISATVERKDKLTKLLYMFLGPLVYSLERKKDDIVTVYGIEYQTNDPDFNEVEVDFRGQPKFSTMISKICDYAPRQEFILRILTDLVHENPDAYILILAHNRSILVALHEGIEQRGITTCGFYLGGMKQKCLKESESKHIVLATYAMAAEALDLPHMSILCMLSSKTDVIQSVGRILRKKHENPMIIDVTDKHSLFQNQWVKRKRYYRKCGYRIRYTTSQTYKGGFNDDDDNKNHWTKVFDPKPGAVLESFAKDQEHDEEPVTVFGGKCMVDVGMFSNKTP